MTDASVARTAEKKANGLLVLRKYGNRRLYNPQTAAYITLTDIMGYVTRGYPLQVLQHKTNIDITTEVLFDILRLKHLQKPVLSTDELVHLICGPSRIADVVHDARGTRASSSEERK